MSCWLPAPPLSQSKRLASTDVHNEPWSIELPITICLQCVTGCTHDSSIVQISSSKAAGLAQMAGLVQLHMTAHPSAEL